MHQEDCINEIYNRVAQEISNDYIDQGIWMRAIAESDNNVEVAKSRYAKLRVEQILREIDSTIISEQSKIKENKQNDAKLSKILEQAQKKQKWQLNRM